MARRALGPATLAVVQAVDAALDAGDTSVLVACSGGADSRALAAATRHVAVRRDLTAAAVVVDHGLQDSSADQAATVAAELRTDGYVDVVVERVVVETTSSAGLEAAARTARYAALSRQAERRDASILVGHTLDDQAETVLLGLVRGSGPRSLAGMAPRVGRVLRPLLGVRRRTTEQACAELGLLPWSDPHNADPRFARVRIRQRILPGLETDLGPGVAEALARTAGLARADADLLDELAAAADPGTADLGVEHLGALPAALRSRVLRRWLRRVGAGELGWTHVQQVDALVTAWRGQGRLDLPGVGVRRRQDRLRVEAGTDR